ncbi:Hypothetical_protein [Hexamita inflata]|uniref:Hypothetical_protein n=1 Tax=Hexamita inflata TaxID=28002 RepID=A0AA86NIV1_9EUKA|nr:Hypothetical protein HINF_LOCUS7474 [Hexamita inflata]
MNNVNYAVYRDRIYQPMSPIRMFKKPGVPRCFSYLSIIFIIVGVVLIITVAGNGSQSFENFGVIAGGAVCAFIGVAMGLYSISSCCLVQSCAYIMFPCCVGESERKALEEQAVVRTPMLNVVRMTQVTIPQNQVNQMNQQITQQQQQQAQPVQNQMQVQQQFVNQQNVAKPYMPVPVSAITAPVQLEISPVM